MKDERIHVTVREVGTQVFYLWFFLLLSSLLYRLVYLRQPLGDNWDILLIFFLGAVYASFALVSKGAISDRQSGRFLMIIAPTIAISMTVSSYFLGNQDITTLALMFVYTFAGAGAFFLLFGVIYRRWDRDI
ncbi:MAG: DUF6773 family protein [Chloroflexota bacterium]